MDLRYLCFGVFGWFTDGWYCLLDISICVVMGVLVFWLWLVLVVLFVVYWLLCFWLVVVWVCNFVSFASLWLIWFVY